MPKDLEKTRNNLLKIKLKRYSDLSQDLSNLDSILDEYRLIASTANDLLPIKSKDMRELLSGQPAEFFVYKSCVSHLKYMSENLQKFLEYTRGVKYLEIRRSRDNVSDLSDRALNQIIDGNDEIRELNVIILTIKEIYEEFVNIVESYHQRGYTLTNITKLVELEALDKVI